MPRSLSHVLAVVLPLFVLALGAYAVLALGADDSRFNLAGNVVAKLPRRAGARAYIAGELAVREPRVLVLGDSTAGTNIDRQALARAMRVPPNAIVNLSMPGSTGAHWYAVLDNLLFGPGHRPQTVVMVGAIHSLLATDPATEGVRASLEGLLDGDDPVLQRKAGIGGIPLLERVRASRVRLRTRLTDVARAEVVGRWWSPESDGRGWAIARVDSAIRHELGRKDLALQLVRAIAPTPFEVRELSGDPDVPVVDTLVPDLVDVCRAHGARVVIVRPPFSPIAPAASRDLVSPAVEAEVARVVRDSGGAFVDLSRWPLGLGSYDDLVHLGPEGARRFSWALGERLSRDDDAPRQHRPIAGARYAGPPPALALAPPSPGPLGTTTWAVPQLPEVIDAWVGRGGEVPPDCAPLRVVADGAALPRFGCSDLLAGRQDGTCFDGVKLIARSRSSLTVEADPERGCGGLRWLFPGDTVSFDAPAGALAVAGDAAPRVAVGARTFATTDRALEAPLAGGPTQVTNLSGEHLALVGLVDGGPEEVTAEQAFTPEGQLWVRPEPAPRGAEPRLFQPANGAR